MKKATRKKLESDIASNEKLIRDNNTNIEKLKSQLAAEEEKLKQGNLTEIEKNKILKRIDSAKKQIAELQKKSVKAQNIIDDSRKQLSEDSTTSNEKSSNSSSTNTDSKTSNINNVQPVQENNNGVTTNNNFNTVPGGKVNDARSKNAEPNLNYISEDKLSVTFNETEYLQDKAKGFYSGANFQDDSIDDKLSNWSSNLANDKNQARKLKNLIAPWDRRFGDAYTSTQSIGADMPHGPQWVGSPSIMNDYALIRFAHVANLKHHQSLIDQQGQTTFRTAGVYVPAAKLSDIDKGDSYILKNQTYEYDGETYNKVDKSKLPSEYYTPTVGREENVYADASGQLFIIYTDKNFEVWECKKKEALSKYSSESTDDITVQVIADWEDGSNKQNYSSNYKGEPRPGKKGADGKTYNEDVVIQYWAGRNGLVKCKSSTSNPNLVVGTGYTKQSICDKLSGKNNGGKPENIDEKEYQENKDEISKFSGLIKAHLAAEWTFKGYSEGKTYIPKPGSQTGNIAKEEILPTEDNLCNFENWKGNEQFCYKWSDFMYCSDFGMIPNNRLITLRRYPVAVFDHGKILTQDDTLRYMLPTAKAVTWIGTEGSNSMESLSSFSWKMNWKELAADVYEVQGNEQGLDESGLDGGMFGKISKALGVVNGQANFDTISGKANAMSKFDPYANGPYANLPYGPVNVIHKTLVRDRGLDFDHSITLVFKYDLKSIGGINPKAALLDIIANFLALTSNNAAFWGGAIRYFPNVPAYPFPGAKKGMEAWYNGDVGGFVDAIGDQFAEALGNLGDMLLDLFSNPVAALKKLGGQGAKLWMAKKQAGNRPGRLGFKGLLTGESIGEWHLMVGNPFNPILMIGNLVVEGAKMQLAETLGADDFPEWVKFEVNLKHARPRDKGDIESMLNRGQGRLHYPYNGQGAEPWNNAQSTKQSTSAINGVNMDDPKNKKASQMSQGTQDSSVGAKNNATSYYDEPTVKSTGQSSTNRVNTAKKYKIEKFTGISSIDDLFSTPFRNIKKVYSSGAQQAVKLSEKVGFKNAKENPSK